MPRPGGAIIVALILAIGGPGRAQEESAPVEAASDVNRLLKRVEELEKFDAAQKAAQQKKDAEQKKTPTVKWTAQLQADRYWVAQNEASRADFGDIQGGAAFRRARIGIFGDYAMTDYRIEVDFAFPGRPSFLDVFAGLKDLPYLGRLRVGHFFEPWSLERRNANRYVTFMERDAADQAFAPARNLGIKANKPILDGRATWEAGVFRSDSDIFGDDFGDRFETAFTGRVTALPFFRQSGDRLDYLHVGVGYSFRAANAGTVRFRAQPEARLGAAVPNIPFLVDTGPIPARNYQLIGFETAWIRGPFSLQGEAMLVPVDAGVGPLFFTGWYTQASLFLTGESRPYRSETGTFERVIPRREFLRKNDDGAIERGPGAWEVAFRVSQTNLDSASVRGGRMTDLTLGLNWYMNPFLRATANYVWALSGGSRAGAQTNLWGMRIGYDF